MSNTHVDYEPSRDPAIIEAMLEGSPQTWLCVVNKQGELSAHLQGADVRHMLAIDPRLQNQLRDVFDQIIRANVQADDSDAIVVQGLTRRQLEIAKMVKEGASNKIIARSLGLTVGTVKVHMHRIFRVLQIQNRVQLAMLRFSTSQEATT